jgi:CYTH domain-containing protein
MPTKTHKPKKKEIERRFLMNHVPPLFFNYPASIIHQGYLADGSGTRLREETIDERTRYYRTIKKGTGVEREENEREISPRYFRQRWREVEASLWKVRYHIPCGNHLAELNFFCGRLSGYVQIEVEFNTREEADAFVPPDWFGREVTDDPRHSNYELARNGAPKEA